MLTEPLDPIAAAAQLYESVRSEFRDAIYYDRRRYILLTRQMRAAGLPVSSCYGPHSPLVRWRRVWLAYCTDASADDESDLQQDVLPVCPPAPRLTCAVAVARGVPHPAFAPPVVLPPLSWHAYVAPWVGTPRRSGWGVVLTRGADCLSGHDGVWHADLAGPLAPFDAVAVSPVAAALAATVASFDVLLAGDCNAHKRLLTGR